MSSEPLKLYLPCEVFTVRALLAPSERVTPLVQLVLRAVHAGADTIGVLDTIFELGPRPMLRLVLHLLDSGDLTINYETGVLRLGGEAAEAFAKGTPLGALRNVEVHPRTIELMCDLVSGAVFRSRRRTRVVRAGYKLEPRLPRGSYRKLDKGRLMFAANEVARGWTSRTDRELKLIELGLDLGEASGVTKSGEQRILELEVRVHRDSATDYARISIVRPGDLGALVQRQLENELTHLANQLNPPLALKNLRDHAEPASLKSNLDLEPRIAELRNLVSRMASADPGTFPEWQATLAAHARDAEVILAEHATRRLHHTVLSAQEDQAELIEAMIQRCGRQLVLCCPFVRYAAVNRYRKAIEGALRRGVRVFLLWGIALPGRDPQELDMGLTNVFDGLRKSYPRLFFVSRIPADVHAKFVVGDASEIFVTSYNYLNHLPDRVFEIGVWIGASTPGPLHVRSAPEMAEACVPALRALDIAHEVFPDLEDRQRIFADAVDFGASEAGADIGTGGWPTRKLEEGIEGVQPLMDRVWRRRWDDYVDRFSAILLGLGTTFELVRDARHHQLLYDALRSARSRILILSDQLNRQVVNRRFLDELKAALSRSELTVTLLCHRPQDDPLKNLRALEQATDGRLRVRVARGVEGESASHAKVLIADDSVVVSSYNFLSFASDDESTERYAYSTEVGILMRGGWVADAVLNDIVRSWPELRIEEVEIRRDAGTLCPTVFPPPPRSVEQLLPRIAHLVETVPANEGAHAVGRACAGPLREWFSSASSAEAALLELEYLQVAAPNFMDQAIASCLEVWEDQLPLESVAKWRSELVVLRWWERLDVMGTLVLLPLLNASERSPAIPPQDIVELAAWRDLLGLLPSTRDDAVLRAIEATDDAAQRAAAALLIPAAIYADDGPVETLEVLAEHLTGGLATWAHAALDFRNVHLQGLSRNSLYALISSQKLRGEADALRADLSAQLDATCALKLDFKMFQLVWQHLKKGELGFDKLHVAAVENDFLHVSAFVAHCRERYGLGRNAPARMLDTAVEEAGGTVAHQYRKIDGKFRRLCLTHIEAVMSLARRWVEVAAALDASGVSLNNPPVEELVLAITASKPAVDQQRGDAADRRSFEAPLLSRMIDDLEPVWRLGGSLP